MVFSPDSAQVGKVLCESVVLFLPTAKLLSEYNEFCPICLALTPTATSDLQMSVFTECKHGFALNSSLRVSVLQVMVSLSADTTFSGLQDVLARETGVPAPRQRLRSGFPPRELLPPPEGHEGDPVPLQNGDKVTVEVLPDPIQGTFENRMRTRVHVCGQTTRTT